MVYTTYFGDLGDGLLLFYPHDLNFFWGALFESPFHDLPFISLHFPAVPVHPVRSIPVQSIPFHSFVIICPYTSEKTGKHRY